MSNELSTDHKFIKIVHIIIDIGQRLGSGWNHQSSTPLFIYLIGPIRLLFGEFSWHWSNDLTHHSKGAPLIVKLEDKSRRIHRLTSLSFSLRGTKSYNGPKTASECPGRLWCRGLCDTSPGGPRSLLSNFAGHSSPPFRR